MLGCSCVACAVSVEPRVEAQRESMVVFALLAWMRQLESEWRLASIREMVLCFRIAKALSWQSECPLERSLVQERRGGLGGDVSEDAEGSRARLA